MEYFKKGEYFTIPSQILETKYRGCGNGIVVFDRGTGEILDMDYTNGRLKPIAEQNIAMCDNAGRVVRQDDQTITVRANFSCCQALMF